ncbi:hypothetical protein BJY24_002387 [Nocardia transvalensis]|uniref:Uncharacterized protein n=1 Tax=Nocardia transvalensis TaxID=37333 RepID=A0A7W9PCI4_9NOCA|nr:hypothetical protein [Nocardia transvalensis]MBB5913520.1 hypothetical protein [Nocardia transvalensis]
MYEADDEINRILAQQVGWSPFDDHLLYTCGVVEFLRDGRLSELPPRPTRVRLEHGELPLAEGPAVWSEWRPAGDGSWNRNQVSAFGSLGFVAAAHLGNAALNRSRRHRAEQARQPRWIASPPAMAVISDRRIFLADSKQSWSVYWSGLDQVDLLAPDRLGFKYSSADSSRPVTAQVHCPWAPLIFVIAAYTNFPNHPTLLSGTWLPPNFEEKCHLAGKPCPNVRNPPGREHHGGESF